MIDGLPATSASSLPIAQSWATQDARGGVRQRIATDGHAPGQYRALTVRNLDPWYKAFDVTPGDEALPAAGKAGENLVKQRGACG